MVKATTTRVIAFDLDEALNFEGETGPYLQYSFVRERNIRRKLDAAGIASEVVPEQLQELAAGVWADDLWDLVLATAQIPETVAKAAETLELSLIARQALDLAQKFHAAYHHHPILHESDPALRRARLGTNLIFRKGLLELAELLGLPVPEKM
ncbi:MAG: hypothetical protein HC897_00825 [Thermoanaerobaculia bacterium]|nr:hypothetical protein [Thermoanaerobaculia bacterium]